MGVGDPGNTFDTVGKPLKDMMLIQQYDADTKERGGGCDYGLHEEQVLKVQMEYV